MPQMDLAFKLMGYGLVGVFSVLIAFYVLIKMLHLFSRKIGDKQEKD